MNDRFTIDKKLELLEQVRSRYDHDQSDLARREWILYGNMPEAAQAPEEQPFSSFSLRLLLAVGLFLLLIICDLSGKNFFGFTTAQCFQAISQDYESSITRFLTDSQALW